MNARIAVAAIALAVVLNFTPNLSAQDGGTDTGWDGFDIEWRRGAVDGGIDGGAVDGGIDGGAVDGGIDGGAVDGGIDGGAVDGWGGVDGGSSVPAVPEPSSIILLGIGSSLLAGRWALAARRKQRDAAASDGGE